MIYDPLGWKDYDVNQYRSPQTLMELTVSVFIVSYADIGTVSKQDFNVLKVIGKGAFGTVYLVTHRVTEKVYAMKVVSKELLLRSDQDDSIKGKKLQKTKTEFIVEREILSRFNHPFIMRLEFAFHDEFDLYLIMEFVNGGELFHHLHKQRQEKKGFSEELV